MFFFFFFLLLFPDGYCAACCRSARCRVGPVNTSRGVGPADTDSICDLQEEIGASFVINRKRRQGSIGSRRRPRSCGAESGVSTDYPLSPTESFNSHQHLPYAANHVRAFIEGSSTVTSFENGVSTTCIFQTSDAYMSILSVSCLDYEHEVVNYL